MLEVADTLVPFQQFFAEELKPEYLAQGIGFK